MQKGELEKLHHGTVSINEKTKGGQEEKMKHPVIHYQLPHTKGDLLEAAYDIPADFFNRHLPDTEAMSDRIILRLLSSPQMDFDEIYESTATFSKVWPKRNILEGH